MTPVIGMRKPETSLSTQIAQSAGAIAAAFDSSRFADYGATGKTGNLAATAIYSSAPAGVYFLVAFLTVTAAATAGTISAQAGYSGGGIATAFTGFTIAVTGTTQGSVGFYHAGGDISVSTTETGLVGSATYDIRFGLIRIG